MMKIRVNLISLNMELTFRIISVRRSRTQEVALYER